MLNCFGEQIGIIFILEMNVPGFSIVIADFFYRQQEIGKMVPGNRRSRCHGYHIVYHAFQFADISRPMIRFKAFKAVCREF